MPSEELEHRSILRGPPVWLPNMLRLDPFLLPSTLQTVLWQELQLPTWITAGVRGRSSACCCRGPTMSSQARRACKRCMRVHACEHAPKGARAYGGTRVNMPMERMPPEVLGTVRACVGDQHSRMHTHVHGGVLDHCIRASLADGVHPQPMQDTPAAQHPKSMCCSHRCVRISPNCMPHGYKPAPLQQLNNQSNCPGLPWSPCPAYSKHKQAHTGAHGLSSRSAHTGNTSSSSSIKNCHHHHRHHQHPHY